MMGDAYIKSTRAFIDENKLNIVFERSEWTLTAAGGKVRGDTLILDPQDGRLVESGRIGDRNVRSLPEGRVVEVVGTITLMPDADVEPGDITTISSQKYEVLTVGGRWAKRAEVIRYGKNQVG